jgi:hypothetical protein
MIIPDFTKRPNEIINPAKQAKFSMFEARKQSSQSNSSEFTFHNDLISNNCSNYKSNDSGGDFDSNKKNCGVLIDKDILTNLIHQNSSNKLISLEDL